MGEPSIAGKAVLKSFTKTLTEPKIAALSVSLVVSLVFCIYIYYYYSEKSLTTTFAETPWMNSEKTSSMAPTTSASLVL